MCIRDRSCTGSQIKEIKKIAVGLMVETQSDYQTKRLLTLVTDSSWNTEQHKKRGGLQRSAQLLFDIEAP